MKMIKTYIVTVFLGALMWSCQSDQGQYEDETPQSLREAYADDFLIGTALGYSQLIASSEKEQALIAAQFSVVTPENMMKWERIHPEPYTFNFGLPDSLIELASRNNQKVFGHTLAWHSQTPDWLFEDSLGNLIDTATLFARMEHHINNVAGRYKGKILGWDVVNEALNNDGSYRNSKYFQIAGEEFIFKAFEYAAKADPNAELYYNDYSMNVQSKVDGAVKIATKIREKGLRIDGIGMQGHWGIDRPSIDLIEQSILKIHDAGFKVAITELDIDVLPNPYRIEGANISDSFENNAEANPYADGLPDSVNQAHAKRYEELFKLFLKHKDKIDRVTFWGVHDGHSWKNDWPARGRTNYCLVFDRNLDPKLAYDKIMALKSETH